MNFDLDVIQEIEFTKEKTLSLTRKKKNAKNLAIRTKSEIK